MYLVIAKALKFVEQNNSINSHCFYIKFKTTDKNVKISKNLKKKYKKKFTIAIRKENFKDLRVYNKYFYINLTINKEKEEIQVPFNSIISFNDPSIAFELEFTNSNSFELYCDQNNCSEKTLDSEFDKKFIFFEAIKNFKPNL